MELRSAQRLIGALLDDRGDGGESLPDMQGYRLTRRIGQGAGGVVYEGVAVASGRPVALKLLHAKLGGSTDRAWRELDALSQIHSPVVPHVVDYGRVTDGRMFIATELVEGRPVLECARDLDRRGRVELLAKIADAAQVLHEHGVIHRDLKPSNILVTATGVPVILDLGIASLIASDVMQTLTAEGAPIGTPAYMAPEQARGERKSISTRSDVYAVGAIGYELLTGQTPHAMDETLYEQVRRVGHDEPREPRSLDASLPKPLAAVLGKACARRPQDRYESAAALAEDLRRWLRREPVTAGRQRIWTRAVRWIGRHPIAATAAACAALVAFTAASTAASVWWLNQQPVDVVVSTDGRRAEVVTRTGKPLHTWRSTSTAKGTVIAASLADRPERFGSGRVILTVIHDPDDPTIPNQQLCVWTFERQPRLLWSTPDSAPEITPPDSFGYRPDEGVCYVNSDDAFGVTVADVFPSLPGSEILVVHNYGPWAARAVRIYDFAGKVLYEAWHDGEIRGVAWLPDAGLLICAGGSRAYDWDELGIERLKGTWPLIVFALRPELDARLGCVNTPDNVSALPVWYRCILPPETSKHFTPQLSPALHPSHRASRAVFSLQPRLGGAIFWEIDQDGALIPGTFGQSDGYPLAETMDPAPIHLGELPWPGEGEPVRSERPLP